MMDRGARKFVFLGRSGLKKKAARDLVKSLQAAGAEVSVIQGDVCNRSDVDKAVASIQGPLGGVVQAAMGLSVSQLPLIPSMPARCWDRR